MTKVARPSLLRKTRCGGDRYGNRVTHIRPPPLPERVLLGVAKLSAEWFREAARQNAVV
jgi:hypothetical protein